MAGLQANETHNRMQKRKAVYVKKDYELLFFLISCQHAKLLEQIVSQYARNKEIISQAAEYDYTQLAIQISQACKLVLVAN
jgi:hypothetical protein